jgi:protein-disulfide isomerase
MSGLSRRPSRRAVLAGLASAGAAAFAGARAGTAQSRLPEGQRLPGELVEEAFAFPGALRLGTPNGSVGVAVFFDANCPWCRKADPDIRRLAARDKDLRLVVIDWPVLGLPSVQAARVGYGVLRAAGPARHGEFLRRTMAAKGVMDGPRALELVRRMGLDAARVEAEADGEAVRLLVRQAVSVGENLGFAATPAYVVHDHGFSGALPADALARMIASVRACEKIAC